MLSVGEIDVMIAHLKQGSITHAVGDVVQSGDYLARSGNSGNSTEPHLHIHAEVDGRGVPLIMNGRYLIRNSVVVASNTTV